MNPLIDVDHNPFHIPVFEKLKAAHFQEAFEQGLAIQNKEYTEIESNQAEASFKNTVIALERSGRLLSRTTRFFHQLLGAHSSSELNELAQEMSPLLAAHQDRFALSTAMFKRIQSIIDCEYASLNQEEQRMLDELSRTFIRSGVALAAEDRHRLATLNQELASLSTKFRQNLSHECNHSYLLLTNESDLEGLPQSVRAQAHALAQLEGFDHAWMFKATQGSMYPFLTYAKHAHLREELYQKYIQRCAENNEFNNQPLIQQMSALRLEKAKLLGYKNYTNYVLANTMATTSQRVEELLDTVWEPALTVAQKELQSMRDLAQAEWGDTAQVKASDWWYYAEKIRQERYAVNSEEIQAYFPCDQVLAGAFKVVKRLFGLHFNERHDLPKYHPDVRTFEVLDADQSCIGIFYTDYFARPSKRGGAWMSSLYQGSSFDGICYPVVFNVCNFTPATPEQPSLLTVGQIRTLFHELGHALHGLLSKTRYPMLSGTQVPRDFVEFPSQMMENWGLESEVMHSFSSHYQTGESIPQVLLDQLQASMKFNQGFATVEYCAASYLDLAWHSIEEAVEDPATFEQSILTQRKLIPEIASRYRSTYFAHIFAGGYAAGYYSYLWSAVLDKDAYQLFKTSELFETNHAANLRTYIYAAGNSKDPMGQYKKLCGREPSAHALMQARGLLVNKSA